MKLDELKNILTQKYGVTLEKVANLSKKELEALVKSQETFATAEEVVVQKAEDVAEVVPPEIGSTKWTDYVMSLFEKSELENGMPKADALRRIACHLFSSPVSSHSNVIQVPTIENNCRATVVVNVEVLYQGEKLSVSGAADVFSGNTDDTFAKHPVATAETRAEGRALRKLLCLTKILTAEELRGADDSEPSGFDNRIASGMLTGLKIMSDKLKVDLFGVANAMDFKITILEDLTKSQGLKICEKLRQYQQGTEEIPEQLKI